MKIVDLANAIAPGCRHEIVGIRPGEKLHEVMIPIDEARNTLEYADHYVIQPQFEWWGSRNGRPRTGKPVPEGFSYRSDNNTWWLSEAELKRLLEEAP